MKKIVLIFVAVMMMAFSSVCMAADGGDLNKDQKVAETFISGITTEKVPYNKLVEFGLLPIQQNQQAQESAQQ